MGSLKEILELKEKMGIDWLVELNIILGVLSENDRINR